MSPSQLLRWQWEGYPRYHQSRFNLLLHVVVIPLFMLGNVTVLFALFQGSLRLAVAGFAAMVVSVALQGRGHNAESNPPEPFTSPVNAISRIFLEQWITFPRFVLSGGWLRALRVAPSQEAAPK